MYLNKAINFSKSRFSVADFERKMKIEFLSKISEEYRERERVPLFSREGHAVIMEEVYTYKSELSFETL